MFSISSPMFIEKHTLFIIKNMHKFTDKLRLKFLFMFLKSLIKCFIIYTATKQDIL